VEQSCSRASFQILAAVFHVKHLSIARRTVDSFHVELFDPLASFPATVRSGTRQYVSRGTMRWGVNGLTDAPVPMSELSTLYCSTWNALDIHNFDSRVYDSEILFQTSTQGHSVQIDRHYSSVSHPRKGTRNPHGVLTKSGEQVWEGHTLETARGFLEVLMFQVVAPTLWLFLAPTNRYRRKECGTGIGSRHSQSVPRRA
jgi:hypothetical protein